MTPTNRQSPYARWHPFPLGAATLTGGFWSRWQALNRRVTIHHGYRMLEEAGNLDNMRIAAGKKEGQFRGMIFQDSDIYKWLEAVGYELTLQENPALRQQADEVIDLIAAAQAPDGYLNTYYQIVDPGGRWSDLDFGHELYCAGHLFQAAVAYTRGTGTTKLLDVARRFADLIAATFGPDKRQGAPGHPEVEMALIDLYRLTGVEAYRDVAKFFIDDRGKNRMRGLGWLKAEYHQDRVPVREADGVEGHAVRAMYLNAGVADLYLETGEKALFDALDRQWRDMVGRKMYLTGGVGSRYEGEAFGLPYELPPDVCYCETCAAIGSVLWNWRMLLATGDARYADVMERTLHNGVLSGLALDGAHFFYMNPLQSRGNYERKAWYRVACCPPNLMRTIASLGRYVATYDDSGVQIHLYNEATITGTFGQGRSVALAVQTGYPWQGDVTIRVDQADGAPWTLRIRAPGWSDAIRVSLSGEAVVSPRIESGYLVLERAWASGDIVTLSLSMEPAFIEAHPQVDAVRGSLAMERGPLVYCIEAADHPGVDLMNVRLDDTTAPRPVELSAFGAEPVVGLECAGYVLEVDDQQPLYRRADGHRRASLKPVRLRAIPYFLWANRGANAMRVWIPRAHSSEGG